jgi:hypothetical protein
MKKHGVAVSGSLRMEEDEGCDSGAGAQDAAAEKFKDSKFYMSYGTENVQSSYVEAALQPQSALRSTESMSTS